MSSTTKNKIMAIGLYPFLNMNQVYLYKGMWNGNKIKISNDLPLVIVDKNIHEYGGGQNVRCFVHIEHGIAIISSSQDFI